MSGYSSDASSFSHPSSFSDQRFKASGGRRVHASIDSGDSDSENSLEEWGTISYTGKSKEGYLSTIFSSSVFPKDIYDAGKVVIYPKYMHRMLSSEYPKILTILEETYGLGAFIYVGSSFQCLFARYTQRFHKIKTELICDMCIFANNKPAILLTVAKNRKQGDHLISYNLEMKRNLEEWISETCVEFKALSVVVTPEDFQFRGNFKRIISYAETQSPTKVLHLTLETMILTVETFLRKLATCKFVQRFYGVSETVYLDEDLFQEFIELMEEENPKTVYSKCSEYTMLLACELGYRLALIGHTSIHSKSEKKREFEQLRKAQNLSISITYDDSIAHENLEESDVCLSSWKGGVIIFRTEKTETAAARRTLAASVVNCSAKVQDEETRNELMDLVYFHIRRTEEQLKNTLRRADSKSQIAELVSFNINPQDEVTETCTIEPTVEADAAHRLPTPEIPGYKDRSKWQDLDSEYTDSETSQSSNNSSYMAKLQAPMDGEYLAGDAVDMTPSHNTNRDKARDISSARVRRQSLSVVDDTMHNVHTAQGRTKRWVTDLTDLQKWLSMHDLPTANRNLGYMHDISTEDPRTPIRNPNRIRRSVSEVTRQRKHRCMTLLGDQLQSRGQHLPQHQRQTAVVQQSRQPTGISEIANQNETRQARGRCSSNYSTNAETHYDQQRGHKAARPLRVKHSTHRSSDLQNNGHGTTTKPSLQSLSVIPKNIVKQRSIAFE